MGLSHAAMAGLYYPNLKMTIVESNFKTRMLLHAITGKNIRITNKASCSQIRSATHAVIATPPRIHMVNLDQLCNAGFTGRLLVEKPVAIRSSALEKFDDIMSGYVLRHSYFWRRFKESLSKEVVNKIKIRLETNQDFGLQGGMWRLHEDVPGLSLLHEFGSHCINLLLDLVPVNELYISLNEKNRVVLTTNEYSDFTIDLCAKSTNVRKSVYTITANTDTAKYQTDFYSFIKIVNDEGAEVSSSLAAEGVRSQAYLRGVDFSEQMAIFLGGESFNPKDIADALATDQLLAKIEEVMQCQK